MSVIEFPGRAQDSTDEPDRRSALEAIYSSLCRQTLQDLAYTKVHLKDFLDGPEYNAVYHLIETIEKRVAVIGMFECTAEADLTFIYRCLNECKADLSQAISFIRRSGPP